jgi:polyisoprenyl-phosphate glycosyltransferase
LERDVPCNALLPSPARSTVCRSYGSSAAHMMSDPLSKLDAPVAAQPWDPAVAPSLSIALPAYNEESTLEAIVREALDAALALGDPFEILIVDDGSTDATSEIAARLEEEIDVVRVHRHSVNLGFAGAMRSCIAQSLGEYVFMAPSDGQGRLHDLRLFWALKDHYDLIFSSRLERKDSPRRKASSGLWYLFLRFLFAYQIPEFSALFLFRRGRVPSLPIAVREDGLNFLPLLYMTAMKQGMRVGVLGILEQPRRGGDAKGFDIALIARTIGEDFKIWWRVRIRPPR